MDLEDAFIFKVSKQVDFMLSGCLTHILTSSSMHMSKQSDQDHLCSVQKTMFAFCLVLCTSGAPLD